LLTDILITCFYAICYHASRYCRKKNCVNTRQGNWWYIVLGIDDPWIWGVYLLCILSALLCVIYGIISWNREGDLEAIEIKEEAAWEEREEEMQEKELGL
jgi:hypothetical protein